MNYFYDSNLDYIEVDSISIESEIPSIQLPMMSRTTFSQYSTSKTVMRIITSKNHEYWMNWIKDQYNSSHNQLSSNYKRDFFLEKEDKLQSLFYDIRGGFISEYTICDNYNQIKIDIRCDYFQIIDKPLFLIRDKRINEILK